MSNQIIMITKNIRLPSKAICWWNLPAQHRVCEVSVCVLLLILFKQRGSDVKALIIGRALSLGRRNQITAVHSMLLINNWESTPRRVYNVAQPSSPQTHTKCTLVNWRLAGACVRFAGVEGAKGCFLKLMRATIPQQLYFTHTNYRVHWKRVPHAHREPLGLWKLLLMFFFMMPLIQFNAKLCRVPAFDSNYRLQLNKESDLKRKIIII